MFIRQKYRRPAANVKQEQDDDSDAEELTQLVLRRPDGLEPQIIHSGHFMVSSPHSEHPPKKGYDFDTVNKNTCQTYRFGKQSTAHFSIDASLTKLFECMTLAYSGKLVSPKWKNFKGLKLLWRDKIRLNNAIWRAWYMQYVEKRENPVCHFVTPLDGSMDLDVHRPAEAVATEGKCWKRRIEIVIREYHKWRTYFKKRLQKHKDDDLSSLLKDEEFAARRVPRRHNDATPAPMEMDPLFDMDVLMSEFSDTLFSTLASHQPIAWPNPREIAHAGNADMIQPGLIPLQPNLDFMDSFDPLQDLFHSLRPPIFSSVSPTAPSVTPLPSSTSQPQAQLMSSMQLSANHSALPPPLANQSGGPGGGDSSYVQSFLPLFPGQVTSSDPSSVSQCLPAAPPLDNTTATAAAALDETVASSSVITHTASSSTATPASSFPPGSEYNSISQQPPAPSQLQSITPLPPTPAAAAATVQQQQMFALPRPFQPAATTTKNRHVQRIAPANAVPSPHLILTAPFPGHGNAVIVTPTPMKAEMGPNRVVITPHLTSPGFHVVAQTKTSPQPIVAKEESFSPGRKNQKNSTSVGPSQPGSGQGSPCALDQAPSPQSLISSSNTPPSRRTTHICAEQKRRSNINIGFKTLCNLVPTLKSQSNITNAVTLQKTVEHIGKLQQERQQMQEEVKRLREEIEELNAAISLTQEQLPATGVPSARHRVDLVQEKFNEYVKTRSLQNWKFWIFSIIIKPLFESFNGTVLTSSRAELCQTTMTWLDRHCSLPVLRPMVLMTLRQLSTTTSILSDPSLLPEEVIQAVTHTHL